MEKKIKLKVEIGLWLVNVLYTQLWNCSKCCDEHSGRDVDQKDLLQLWDVVLI